MNATAEIIEGQAKVVSESPAEDRALAIVPERQAHLSSGLGAIAAMSDEAFARNLELLRKAKVRAAEMQKALLTEGVDYGTVPGIPRPFLHKPGAETFEKAYGFATSYEIERKVGDGLKTPEVEYIVHAKVHLGDTDGPIVAEGVGSCNTHETKYRYRSAKKSCPSCHNEGLIKGRIEGKLKGAYWCPQDKGGCNKRFAPGTPEFEAIESEAVGQVENENPWDLANTMLKMARKRAGVDGILTATGTSGLFTQDDDSPSVQRDARASGAAAAGAGDGGRAAESKAPQAAHAGGRSRLPAMPKPGEIEEPKALGEISVSGLITITDKQRTDGALRQGKTGPVVGFQFDWPDGGKIATVIARDRLAEQLAELTQGDPAAIDGVGATIHGVIWADPWKKKNDEGVEEWMPAARRLEATSIETEHWTLPRVDEPAAKAKAKPAAPKQTTVADAAHEASKTAGAGMTAKAFDTALEAGRIAGTYALSIAKERYGIEALHALTDQQRLELAGELGILAEEEE